MDCTQAETLIGPYVDDNLPAEARRQVEQHLLTCTKCAWDAQTQRIARDRLRGEPGEIVASDAFRARVLSRLRADNGHLAPSEPTEAEPLQYQLPISL